MKICVKKQNIKANKTRGIRLVFDGKSKKTGEHKKRYEQLKLFIYDHPANEEQKKHNENHLKLAEIIKSKRLFEWYSEEYGFTTSTPAQIKTSFFDYFALQVDIRAKTTSASNYSIWISAQKHLLTCCDNTKIALDEVDKN